MGRSAHWPCFGISETSDYTASSHLHLRHRPNLIRRSRKGVVVVLSWADKVHVGQAPPVVHTGLLFRVPLMIETEGMPDLLTYHVLPCIRVVVRRTGLHHCTIVHQRDASVDVSIGDKPDPSQVRGTDLTGTETSASCRRHEPSRCAWYGSRARVLVPVGALGKTLPSGD